MRRTQSQRFDFVIRGDLMDHEPTDEELSELVILRLTLKRIKADKPVIIMFTGQSGEGKSESALKVLSIILKAKGLNLIDWLDKVVIYNQYEYIDKLDKVLNEKEYKDVLALQMDESRNIVKNTNWSSPENQIIADVNAMSRGIKPIAFLIVSQTIGDVDLATRKTITYQLACERPIGERVKMTPYVFYIDDHNPGKVELKKRTLRGIYIGKDESRIIYPDFEVTRLPTNVIKKYKELQYTHKSKLIRQKTLDMIEEFKKDAGLTKSKVDQLFEWYLANPDKLREASQMIRKKVRLRQNLPELINVTFREKKELEARLLDYRPEEAVVLNG